MTAGRAIVALFPAYSAFERNFAGNSSPEERDQWRARLTL